MSRQDVIHVADIEDIVERFYASVLKDPIIGFIFTDVAKIDLSSHLPVIVRFWSDVVFKETPKTYHGNILKTHLDLHLKMPLRPGHFTRWLYLFNQAVDLRHDGDNAELMKVRAESVAKSISAAISQRKRGDMQLTLPTQFD